MRKSMKIRLLENDLRVPELAEHIGRTSAYISLALNGKTKLKVDEAFKIGDLLHMTAEEVREEFVDIIKKG